MSAKPAKYPEVDLNYHEDLEIDHHNLELECKRHARKMVDYSDLLAQAIFDRDKAKESLETTEASLDSSIRLELEGTKFTEAVVKGKIQQTPSHMEAVDKVIKAEYVVNLLKGAVKAFSEKGQRLSDLKDLFRMKYYAEPYDPPESKMTPSSLEQGKQAGVEALKNAISKPGTLPPRPPMRPLPRKP